MGTETSQPRWRSSATRRCGPRAVSSRAFPLLRASARRHDPRNRLERHSEHLGGPRQRTYPRRRPGWKRVSRGALLGLGASHAPLVEGYARPYAHMVSYLDALDPLGPAVAKDRRVLAALGPRMVDLAGLRSAGAHRVLRPGGAHGEGPSNLGSRAASGSRGHGCARSGSRRRRATVLGSLRPVI